ncbi:MAG: hypothetical protein AMJ65_09070 [Phycisphaerae bacterium SG8_4]|nr:MAG: hypothetical protein AMJ65_09070 [Phycisphaerae bacterium SG8_4]
MIPLARIYNPGGYQISNLKCELWALSENSVVGPRGSVFSPGKDGEAGDIGFIVDGAGCSQVDNSGCLYPTVAAPATSNS